MIKRILLAEDERGTALFVKSQLERNGYQVRLAANGREALELLREGDTDLLVTDVVMPEMDGVDLYMAIKADPGLSQLPIIIITDKQVFIESFASLGVPYFVPKLSEISFLLGTIREVELKEMAKRDLFKVLVFSSSGPTVDQMRKLLESCGCLVASAAEASAFHAKLFPMKPHIVLIDVMTGDTVAPSELVRSVRCFEALRAAVVVTFANFSREQVAQDRGAIDALRDEVTACEKAGASRYIGRFNRATFLEAMAPLGIRRQDTQD